MPQDLYKWEDESGLKHHCPICQTPLSHDKCRTVCLGKHVEWCHRYHTLFRKNWSSRCKACKTTDEEHAKRHREIAEILHAIKKLKTEEETTATEVRPPQTPRTPRTPLTVRALNSMNGPEDSPVETPKMTKKERKAAKKAVKNLQRDKVVTTTDIQLVAATLHPLKKDEELEQAEKEEAGPDVDIKENLSFNNSIWTSKSARHDFIAKDRKQVLVDGAEIDGILNTFDVDKSAGGREGELVADLIKAVENDLHHFHDELRMIARQKGGFWRWANKRNYRELVENGKDWDDKEKKPIDSRDSPISDEHRDSVQDAVDDDSSGDSRNGSVDSSVQSSVDTNITVPSIDRKQPVCIEAVAVKNDEPTQASNDTEAGWTLVGTKQLKPRPQGKLIFSGNGGAHRLITKPDAGNYWALRKGLE